MKVLLFVALMAVASIVNCQTRCPTPPVDWSVFCQQSNGTVPPAGYIFTIVLEMPVTFFMDRSVQHCIMIGNGPRSSPLRTNVPASGRLCLYRYDGLRIRQRSESVQLQFYEIGLNIASGTLINNLNPPVIPGRNFSYALLPNDLEFETRFKTNYTEDFLFQVTYIGTGSSVGQEIVDPRGDLVREGFSPFDAGDYIYAILGTIAVIIVCSLFIYGFFIQPYYL